MSSNNFTEIRDIKTDNNNITTLIIKNTSDEKLFNIDLDFSKFQIPFDNIDRLECNLFKLIHFSNININVTYLYFVHSNWTNITSYYFSGLSKLQYLIIKYNNISSIKNNTFKGLISVFDLVLKHNYIVNIEAGAFDGLIRLSRLRLSYNSLVELNTGTFTIFNKLEGYEFINIRGNRLKMIKRGLFDSENIETIDLSNNSIISIESGAFNVTLKRLKLLLNNVLSTIAENVFGRLKNMRNITIYNNKINCNCKKLNWIFNKVNNSKILKFLNSSVNNFVKCYELNMNLFGFMKKKCTNNRGIYIYIYI